MALTQFTSGATLSAADLNAIVDMIQGAAGSTDAFFFRSSTGNDFIIRLADAAGARKFSIQDSAGVEVASIDSDGVLTVASTVFTNLTVPTSATPTQTVEGRIVWDSDDDVLTAGTGTATKRIGLLRGAGSAASATSELMYDTTAQVLQVWDGSASRIISGGWEHIDTQVLAATAASVSFPTFNSAYRQFRLTMDQLHTLALIPQLRFNNDATATYDRKVSADSAASAATAGDDKIDLSATTATFLRAFYVVYIAKPTTGAQALVHWTGSYGTAANTQTSVQGSANYRSATALLDRIDILASTSTFAADSRFVLEGNRTPN